VSEIRVNGVSLYYEEHGQGEPILCIHGTGSSAVLWVDAAVELATRGRTIVYDRRGFARSERPEPYTTEVHQQTDDAAALIEALGAAPAIVIGRSTGGEIAIDLALRYPERVRALAVLEAGGMGLSETYARWEADLRERVFAAAAADMSTVGETILKGILGDASWEETPEPVREIFTANGPAIVAELRGGTAEPLFGAEQLGTISHPTLLVGGRDSVPAFVEVTSLMADAMPGARVEWVEGGHLIDPAHPSVLAFVDEVLAREQSPTAALG
jgi:pimeloyl-ACP methyl ester carboxylesterase